MRILPLTTLLPVLLLVLAGTPVSESQISRAPPVRPRPLCLSQFALANHACSLLPYRAEHRDYDAPPSPSPPRSKILEGMARHHHHPHHHRHSGSGQRQSQSERRHGDTPVEDCCRWLMAVDDECVCEVLLRLPIFLSRPLHQYSVTIADSCSITYICGRRI